MAGTTKSCNVTYERFLHILSISKVLFLYYHFLRPLRDHCCSGRLDREELFHLLPAKNTNTALDQRVRNNDLSRTFNIIKLNVPLDFQSVEYDYHCHHSHQEQCEQHYCHSIHQCRLEPRRLLRLLHWTCSRQSMLSHTFIAKKDNDATQWAVFISQQYYPSV